MHSLWGVSLAGYIMTLRSYSVLYILLPPRKELKFIYQEMRVNYAELFHQTKYSRVWTVTTILP